MDEILTERMCLVRSKVDIFIDLVSLGGRENFRFMRKYVVDPFSKGIGEPISEIQTRITPPVLEQADHEATDTDAVGKSLLCPASFATQKANPIFH